ncbi:ewing's tumor-associated antigen 1 isoform X2 [Oryzias melastigma]|uniref:ewing's tumor-associated antigen 1 isoform X2 n=1 Tax=Oryzias melastigma TaxID=30732 RepID=UPI000CF7FBF8|nr:ewing's tumor-associated antigen 1 isoform X2 [Oryzias melastigma]
MTEERERFCSPPEPGTKPPRGNRLSRSCRQTAAESPRAGGGAGWSSSELLTEFKTPTRIPRPRPAASSAESPHSDSDFQQDIVWDGASPSPRRPGRRTGKQSNGTVSISQIVSRIAPEHGRPRTSEPSLQQWIGDSASIPCTPEVPAARTSRKSPRTSTEVLLKLAQQFDQNLFHQEEGLPPDQNPDYSDHEDSTPAWNAVTDCDQQLENDLDFLFDGPTQSSSLSPVLVLPTEPPELQPAAPTTAAVSTATSRTSSAREPFEDDWDNDDILNDTLVLEMTQNPLKFLTPQLCSTQNPLNQGNAAGPGPRAGKENTRPRTSFRLDRIAGSSERRSKKFWSSEPSGSVACQQRSPETRSVFTWQKCRPITTIPELQGPGPIVQKNPDLLSSQSNPTDVDFLDEDLDSLFSSEPVWDDPADDDLLCGVCDELENQIQNQQRAVLQLTRSAFDNQIQTSGAALTRTAPALTGRGSVSPWQHENSRGAVSMTTGTSGGKCSAAEIELKKQQAVERRRRRLQAAQNLQTQT